MPASPLLRMKGSAATKPRRKAVDAGEAACGILMGMAIRRG
jgi:hypothetical protein